MSQDLGIHANLEEFAVPVILKMIERSEKEETEGLSQANRRKDK